MTRQLGIYIPLWHLLIYIRIPDTEKAEENLHSTMAYINRPPAVLSRKYQSHLHSTMASINQLLPVVCPHAVQDLHSTMASINRSWD